MLPPQTVNREPVFVRTSAASPRATEYNPAETGLLVVGHGTRSQAGQAQLRQVFSQYSQLMEGYAAELCFLELAKPDIATAVQRLAERGISQLVCVPVLLFSAGHAQTDIPGEVEQAANSLGLNVIAQTPALECATAILELSAYRFQQAVCRTDCRALCHVRQPCELLRGTLPHTPPTPVENSAAHARVTCSGQFCSRVGLVMVGRGSRSPSATAKMLEFTRKRCELTPVHWATTAFVFGQEPRVTQALDELQNQDCQLAVVQPHLLFEGQLMNDLREEVEARRKTSPQLNWVITDPLGTDERLAIALACFSQQQAIRKLG